jgi:two-component system chemotaxis response regulator CheB
MPKMDGLTALCCIMAKTPVPVVMLTAMGKIEADLAVKSFEYGAVDFVSKPSKTISLDVEEVKEELINKVRAASTVDVKKMAFKVVARRYIDKLLIPPKTDKKVLIIGASISCFDCSAPASWLHKKLFRKTGLADFYRNERSGRQ